MSALIKSMHPAERIIFAILVLTVTGLVRGWFQ